MGWAMRPGDDELAGVFHFSRQGNHAALCAAQYKRLQIHRVQFGDYDRVARRQTGKGIGIVTALRFAVKSATDQRESQQRRRKAIPQASGASASLSTAAMLPIPRRQSLPQRVSASR